MGQNEIDYLTGPGIEGRHEVAVVKRELGKIGIFLEGFGITITGVYIKPRPFGFDFDCKKPQALLALAMLAPMIANILAYHATMQPSGFPLAIFTTLLWVIVVWRYRAHFTSLFVHKAE